MINQHSSKITHHISGKQFFQPEAGSSENNVEFLSKLNNAAKKIQYVFRHHLSKSMRCTPTSDKSTSKIFLGLGTEKNQFKVELTSRFGSGVATGSYADGTLVIDQIARDKELPKGSGSDMIRDLITEIGSTPQKLIFYSVTNDETEQSYSCGEEARESLLGKCGISGLKKSAINLEIGDVRFIEIDDDAFNVEITVNSNTA